MRNYGQLLIITLTSIVLTACSSGFDPSKGLRSPSSTGNGGDTSFGNIASVSLTSPADQSATRNEVQLTGRCTNGLMVAISGDVNPAQQTVSCSASQFAAALQLTAGDGPKTIRVSQVGKNGVESFATRTFIRDTILPSLNLITPSVNQNVRDSVVIQGSCETGIEVQITENNMTYRVPCTNSTFATTFPLSSADGTVALNLAQTDAAGNIASQAVSVRKDTVAPAVAISSPAANATVGSQSAIVGTCETGIPVEVSGAGIEAMAMGACTNGGFNIATVFTMGAGSKAVQVRQTDAAGNVGTTTRSFNRQADSAPAITISSPAANSLVRTNVAITGTCQTGLTVNFSGAGWSAPASTSCTNGMFSATITLSNGEGVKNIIASQTNAQNQTGSASRSFTRDTTAPAITIASPAANSLGRTSIQIAGACESGIAVQISGAGAAAASSVNCSNGAYSATVNFSSGEGAKAIQVTQTDAAGNVGTANRSFIRDSIAPAITIASPAADTSAATGLTITGACEGTLAVVASGAGLANSVSVACASNMYRLDIVFSSGEGMKTVSVSQTDSAGNTGTVTRNFIRSAPVLNGVALYGQHCAACHGALATSAKQNRTATQISSAITSVGQMTNLSFLTAAQREAIAQALYVAPTQAAFACNANQTLEQKAIPKNIKRLSRRQYINTLNDLFARSFSASASSTLVNNATNGISLPADDDSNFSRFDSTVIRQHMKAYFDISDKLATSLVTSANYSTFISGFINLDRGSCTSVSTTALTTECATRFVNNFGRRALRRPLDSTESTAYLSTYNSAGGNAAGINAVVFRFLIAPNFLYQIENDGAVVSGQLHRLSSYAVASRLSYMFWNSMPDETLLGQAAAAHLGDSTPFATALTYVSDHAKAQDSVSEFLAEWLKLRQIPQFQTNNASLNYLANGLTLDSSLRTAMINEVTELGSYIYRNNLTFNDLFLTDVSFARDSRLMSIYGVSTAAAATVTPANAVRMPAGTRSGLLTRSALLVGGSELANPIKRGIHIRKDILCLPLDNPPADLEDALEPPASDINMTTRQRYDNATSPAVCMNCHQHINSLGHAFSGYNSFGKFQTTEPTFDNQGQYSGRNLAVNTQVDLGISLGAGLSASNAHELSTLIASHRNTRICVSQKALRFAEGRMADTTKEGCRLNNLYDHLVQSHSLKDFLKSVAQDQEFRHRLIGN